jgi:hypothetical protein
MQHAPKTSHIPHVRWGWTYVQSIKFYDFPVIIKVPVIHIILHMTLFILFLLIPFIPFVFGATPPQPSESARWKTRALRFPHPSGSFSAIYLGIAWLSGPEDFLRYSVGCR